MHHLICYQVKDERRLLELCCIQSANVEEVSILLGHGVDPNMKVSSKSNHRITSFFFFFFFFLTVLREISLVTVYMKKKTKKLSLL